MKHLVLVILALQMGSLSANALSGYDPTVIKSNGQKVLINSGVEPLDLDEVYIAYDKNDRKKAAIRIVKVGETRALGKIIKGKVRKGYILEKYERESNREPASFEYGQVPLPTTARKYKSKSFYAIGVLGGSSSNSMSLNIPGDTESSSTPLSMNGSTSEYHVFLDIGMSEDVSLMLSVGQQNFKAVGSVDNEACTESNDCSVDIPYLVGMALLKYEWEMGKFSPWVAAGGGMLKPDVSQATTNAFAQESIVDTGVVTGALGMEWHMFDFLSLQAQGRYSKILNKNTESEIVSILSGLAFHF